MLPQGMPAPGAAAGPKMPGNPAGGPSGPGAPLPMTAGVGAGNEAAADAMVTSVLNTLHKALAAYPPGNKKYMGVLNAIRSLSPSFSKQNQQSLVPSAVLQMAQAAKGGGSPMANSPPPPLASLPPPGTPETPPPMAA